MLSTVLGTPSPPLLPLLTVPLPLPLPFLSPYLSFHPNLLYNRFEARGCGHDGHKKEMPAQVLNASMAITKAGGKIGIPGLYVTEDPGIIFCSILIFSLSFLC